MTSNFWNKTTQISGHPPIFRSKAKELADCTAKVVLVCGRFKRSSYMINTDKRKILCEVFL